MAVSTPIDAPESCPTIVRKPKNVQRELWEAFESAVVKAQKQGIPEEEIFQSQLKIKSLVCLRDFFHVFLNENRLRTSL